MVKPLKWSPDEQEEMQAVIDAYFESCDANDKPYTIPGLARALGFGSRNAINRYLKRPEFKDIISSARLRIEEQRTEQLITQNNPTGKIFDLKNNFGWKDQSEVQQTTQITEVRRVILQPGEKVMDVDYDEVPLIEGDSVDDTAQQD